MSELVETHGLMLRVVQANLPISIIEFDWAAWVDSDEPDDDGRMTLGFGKTKQDAIDDLLIQLD